ncbi:MAG: sulfite exporter TauE/SafE family protein [Hyphomicrobiales bacterium]
MEALIENYGLWSLLGVALVALITSSVHGATGVAGGFLLSAALAPIIGVAPIIPVVSVSLLISHSARALLNAKDFEKSAFFAVSIPALPCIIIMALVYGRMSSSLIALILGCVILISIPLRRWAKAREIKTSRTMLSSVSVVYGTLSGVSIGPGMLLVPFMLGYGLRKEQFVATLAVIALLTNITRVGVFGSTNLLSSEFILIGILCGLITIPGNWIGRTFLRRMTNDNHAGLVDVLTVLGALNFFWLSTQ